MIVLYCIVLPSWTIHAGRGDYSPESESGTNKNMRGRQETQAYRFNRWTFALSIYKRTIQDSTPHTDVAPPTPDTGHRRAVAIAGQTAALAARANWAGRCSMTPGGRLLSSAAAR